jgi:DNA repair protein RadC
MVKKLELLRVAEARGEVIDGPEAVVRLMAAEAKADREGLWVLHLNARHRVIEKELVSLGTLNGSPVHPREVFKKAILNSADAIITVHNHPSGDPRPSADDEATWQRLRQAGEILGIKVLDNLIVTPTGRYYSEARGQ